MKKPAAHMRSGFFIHAPAETRWREPITWLRWRTWQRRQQEQQRQRQERLREQQRQQQEQRLQQQEQRLQQQEQRLQRREQQVLQRQERELPQQGLQEQPREPLPSCRKRPKQQKRSR